MLIVSKFKDYYDGVAGSVGIDKKIVYTRHEETVELQRKDMFKIEHKLPTKNYHNISLTTKENPDYAPIFIVFCGKLYVVYCFSWYEPSDNRYLPQKFVIEYEYDKDKIINRIETILAKNTYRIRPSELKKKISLFYSEFERLNDSKNYFDLCIKHNTPIIVFGSSGEERFQYYSYDLRKHVKKITVNASLLQFEFYKKFTPFDAFQEISMFIGNVLTNPENNAVEISDEYRMAQRGLDKTSFRQAAPGQKKEQRRKNKEQKRQNKIKKD